MFEHHGPAQIGICVYGQDGSAHTRVWQVRPSYAEHLAQHLTVHLGDPDSETLSSPEGVAATRRAMDALPGVVHTAWGPQ